MVIQTRTTCRTHQHHLQLRHRVVRLMEAVRLLLSTRILLKGGQRKAVTTLLLPNPDLTLPVTLNKDLLADTPVLLNLTTAAHLSPNTAHHLRDSMEGHHRDSMADHHPDSTEDHLLLTTEGPLSLSTAHHTAGLPMAIPDNNLRLLEAIRVLGTDGRP